MAQSEIDFLFDVSLHNTINNQDNTKDIYNSIPSDKYEVFYQKDKYGTNAIKTNIKNNVYYNDTSDENPYLNLIKKFKSHPPLTLTSADFAYLKDLGVYPVNKLFVLRKFPEGCVIPVNLYDLHPSVKPVSVVVGWIKNDDAAKELFKFGFHEEWTTTTDMLHTVIQKMIKEEFPNQIMTNNTFAPGNKWSYILLFGFLKNSNLLSPDFDLKNLPFGDPRLLSEGPILGGMEDGKMSINSKFSITLETIYEQKFINNIDPGQAYNDVFSNMIKMGTSNIKYLLNSNSSLITKLITAASSRGDQQATAWMDVFKDVISSFVVGVTESIKQIAGEVGGTIKNIATLNGTELKSTVNDLVNTYLAASVQKYKWPLIGSTAVMTGVAITPWHLTIGNPLMPVLSINNIKVSDIEVSFSNETGFNDLPKEFKATIIIDQARNFGAQEIIQFFNNGYYRIYSQPKT